MIKFKIFLEAFSLNLVSRDSLGIACKATYYEVTDDNGNVIGLNIYKDPKTVSGMPKKSHKGRLCVLKDDAGIFYVKDNCTAEEENTGYLQTVFVDGKLVREFTLPEIRETRIKEATKRVINNYFSNKEDKA